MTLYEEDMEISSLKVLLLNIAVILTMCLTVLAESAKPSVSIAINGPPSTKAGSATKVNIIVTNTSNSTNVFAHGYPDQGEFDFDFNVLSSEGKPVADTRYMKAVKGKDQGPGPQLVINTRFLSTRLEPGKTLKASADLSKLFDLAPGKYTVQLSRFENAHSEYTNFPMNRDTDLHRPEGSQPLQPQPQPVRPRGAMVKSNTITITVTP
jgi:hypothetical protein